MISSYEFEVNTTWNLKVIPHLDNKPYIKAITDYVSKDKVSNTLLIGGPKDSGKTMGLPYVLRAARKIGFSVFELNLKGTVDEQTLNSVMEDFSWQFTDFFEGISNSNELKCIYELLQDCPIIKSSWYESVVIVMETIMTCVKYLLTATALSAVPVLIYQRLINPVPYHYLRKLLHP